MENSVIDVKVIESKALSLPEQAKSLAIINQATFDRAGAMLRDIVTIRSEITTYHAPLKAAAWQSHRTICDAEANMLKPVAQAELHLKKCIGDYEHEQMKIQRQKEEEARRLAQEAADLKRQEEIEAAKQEAESAMDALLNSAQTVDEVEAILKQRGEVVTAAVQEAEQAPALPIEYEVEPQIRKVSGVSTRIEYYVQITSVKKLCGAVADGSAAESMVKPDEGALNRLVNAMKGKVEIAGVTVMQRTGVSARKR